MKIDIKSIDKIIIELEVMSNFFLALFYLMIGLMVILITVFVVNKYGTPTDEFYIALGWGMIIFIFVSLVKIITMVYKQARKI